MTTLVQGSAFITGAAAGLGRATAFSLARHGITQLALGDIRLADLEATKKDLLAAIPDIEVLALELDVRSDDSVAQATATTMSAFGRIDVAINNAGISGPFSPTEKTPWVEWERVYDVNIHGTWRCQKYELQQMVQQDYRETKPGQPLSSSKGVIINVASILGLLGTPAETPSAAYSSTKHAVLGLTKTDARYYADKGIRINAICPGYIETPLLRNLTDDARRAILSKIPAQRLGTPEEVGNAIVFLSSYLSSYMMGHGIVVDGQVSLPRCMTALGT